MRRRFFNAADNFVGGCYNKLSNEDIKRLGGKRSYVCQFNKIHIHIGPVLKDNDSEESYIMFNSDWNHGGYESIVYHHSNNGIFILGENNIGTNMIQTLMKIIVIVIMKLITAEMLLS